MGARLHERAEAQLSQRARQIWSRSANLLAASLNTYWSTHALDLYGRKVTRKLVSNSFLRERFGGVVLPHVRDTDVLDPARYAEAARAKRAELSLGDRPFVAFIGTIREHKGVDDLVQAVARLEGPNAPAYCWRASTSSTPFARSAAERDRALPPERLRVVGMFDGAELPIWVATADVLCIPSRDIPGAWGQLPAKLFDAMSMARPIVASSVSDIARILDGCGLVFPGGDVTELAAQLSRVARDPELGTRLGRGRAGARHH